MQMFLDVVLFSSLPSKASNFCQLRRKPTKTGSKACVQPVSVSASLIPVVQEKQMTWVCAVYQTVGKIYLHESRDVTIYQQVNKGGLGMGS